MSLELIKKYTPYSNVELLRILEESDKYPSEVITAIRKIVAERAGIR